MNISIIVTFIHSRLSTKGKTDDQCSLNTPTIAHCSINYIKTLPEAIAIISLIGITILTSLVSVCDFAMIKIKKNGFGDVATLITLSLIKI